MDRIYIKDFRLIITDLDGVLWSGILSENPNELVYSNEIIELYKKASQEGILLSCVSKNNLELAWNKIKDAEIDDIIIFPVINFSPKVIGVKRILESTHVSAKQALFVDDMPEELVQVQTRYPEMLCLNPNSAKAFLKSYLSSNKDYCPLETQNRIDHYTRESQRGTDHLLPMIEMSNFVASASLTIFIRRAKSQDINRIVELYLRTHRLNFSSTLRSKTELDSFKLFTATNKELLTIHVVDRYGPYGLVGCILTTNSGDTLYVEDLLLSCRVHGRLVEYSILIYLIEIAKKRSFSFLAVRFNKTEHNAHLLSVLKLLNFNKKTTTSNLHIHKINGLPIGKIYDITIPPVVWDENAESDVTGIPFVINVLRKWDKKFIFDSPIAVLGSGDDDTVGDELQRWAETRKLVRIDKMSLPLVDVVDNAEILEKLDDSIFSTVLCLDMLEHCEHPWKVVVAALRVIKEKGFILFSIPCLVGLHCPQMDLWRMTPQGLYRLVQESSDGPWTYDIIDMQVEGSPAYPIRTMLIARKICR